MAGGKPQAGCTLGGCFAASVFIIFCAALTVGFMGGPGESSALDTKTGEGSGTCMDIENGKALSASEIDTLIGKVDEMRLVKGKGKEIYEGAVKYSINPLYSLAVARKESNIGTAYGPGSKWYARKNMMGLGSASYSDWYKGLIDQMRLIREEYLTKGGSSYSQVMKFKNKGRAPTSNDMTACKYPNQPMEIMQAIEERYTPHNDTAAHNNPDKTVAAMKRWMKGWCKLLDIDPSAVRTGGN